MVQMDSGCKGKYAHPWICGEYTYEMPCCWRSQLCCVEHQLRHQDRALRDFLDNSVVPYQISDAKAELKTADIARNARTFTFLISCKAKEKETARN